MNLFGTVQQIETQVDEFAKRVGDVAQQVKDGSAAVSQAVNTPLVITTPTPTAAGAVRPALPAGVKLVLIAVGALVLLRVLR